ncbi:hypothetical protein SDC9_59905 [bioreactor metagenome]|uniref:Uncharacterized protein n=1 Tax=bioreactor metagenome TaxID=1076179 RepID=A0A644XCN8_9ZZZZ
MAIYKLPLGIGVPKDENYPSELDAKAINEKRNSANIVEGFVLHEVSNEKFSNYAEVNIDGDKIWDVFCSLANKLVGDVAYGVMGFKDEDPTLSNFTSKEKLLTIFEEYKFELTNDGFLEFGIAYYDENSMNEIYVSSFKYMRVWTDRKEDLVNILNEYGIEEIQGLQFIDEFPVVSEALKADVDKGIRHYSEVIEAIERELAQM